LKEETQGFQKRKKGQKTKNGAKIMKNPKDLPDSRLMKNKSIIDL
jgi:hypothetical protein